MKTTIIPLFKVYFWWRIGNPEFNYFITPGDYVSKSGVYIFKVI